MCLLNHWTQVPVTGLLGIYHDQDKILNCQTHENSGDNGSNEKLTRNNDFISINGEMKTVFLLIIFALSVLQSQKS